MSVGLYKFIKGSVYFIKMDKYIGRSRLTAANSYYEPSYLYSSAKDTSFSRYHPSLQASPLKLHLEATSIVNQAALNTYLQRSQN